MEGPVDIQLTPAFRNSFRNISPLEKRVLDAMIERRDLSALATELAQTTGTQLYEILDGLYPQFGLTSVEFPHESSRRFFLGKLYRDYLNEKPVPESSAHGEHPQPQEGGQTPRPTTEEPMVELTGKHRRLFRELGAEERDVVFGVAYGYDDAQIASKLAGLATHSNRPVQEILRSLFEKSGLDASLKEREKRALLGRMYLVYQEEIRDGATEELPPVQRPAVVPETVTVAEAPREQKPKMVRVPSMVRATPKLPGADMVAVRFCAAKTGAAAMPSVREVFDAVAAMHEAKIRLKEIGARFGQTEGYAVEWASKLLKLSRLSKEAWEHPATANLSTNALVTLSTLKPEGQIERLDGRVSKSKAGGAKKLTASATSKTAAAAPEDASPPDVAPPDEPAPPEKIVQLATPSVLHVSEKLTVALGTTEEPWHVRAEGTTDICSLPSCIGVSDAHPEPKETEPAVVEYDIGDFGACSRELRRQAVHMAYAYLREREGTAQGMLTQSRLAHVTADMMYATEAALSCFISKLSPERKRALGLWTLEVREAAE